MLEAVDDLLRQRVAIAHLQAGDGLLAQHRLVGFAFRQGEARQDDVSEFERDVALVGDFQRGGQRVWVGGQRLAHLVGALQVELVVAKTQAAFVVHGFARANAQHEVLHLGVFLLEVVHVVGAHALEAHLARQLRQLHVQLRLSLAGIADDFGALVLQLDIEILAAKDVDEGLRPLLRLVHFPAVEVLGDDAGDASAGGQDALVEFLQQARRDERLVVEIVHRGLAHDAHEVAVALVGFGQQNHVVAARGFVARNFVLRREVDLAAKDGLDAGLHGGLVHLGATIHVAVVGDGHRGHAQLLRALAHGGQAGGAVQQRIFRVHVQVDEAARVAAGGGQRGGGVLGGGPDEVEGGDVGHGLLLRVSRG